MPKIFLIAAAVLLLLSSGLSFLNKGKMTAKQQLLNSESAAKQAALADASKARAAQKKAETAASEATAKTTELENTATASSKQVTDLTAQIDEVKKSVADKDTQIAQLNDKLTKATSMATPPPVSAAVDPAMVEMKNQRDELQAVKEGLETQLKSAQSQLAGLQKQAADRATMAAMNGLRGRVLAVDRNWNFVVLDMGNRNGVVNNATLIVQRGTSMVGRVRVTSVEPSQSIADIVPNSVPAGISVEPGDTVIYPGS